MSLTVKFNGNETCILVQLLLLNGLKLIYQAPEFVITTCIIC